MYQNLQAICWRFTAILAMLAALAGVRTAEGQSIATDLSQGLESLQKGRTKFAEQALESAQKSFQDCLSKDPKNFDCEYNLAVSHLYRGWIYFENKKKKEADSELSSGIESADRAIVIRPNSSDAYSVLGDLYGQRAGLGGMFAGMKYGPKAGEARKKALQLDAKNPRAQASMGREYLFAPRAFGGNLDKAAESFVAAVKLDPKFDEAWVWLAVARRKKGDQRGADEALQQARKLNPESAFATQVANGQLP